MTATAHIYEIFIRASQERVWDALVDPDVTVEYFHRTRIESSFIPGERYRYVLADDRDAVEGLIEVFEPPRRLVMTWRVLYDAAMSEEPPSRVEWTLTPVGDDDAVTRVTLRHGDLALSPLTWRKVRLGWVAVIDSLKSYLETGTALPPLEADDVGDPTEIEGNWHRAQAVDANNSAWALLTGSDHSADDADELLQRVYTAAYHWNRATGRTDVNRARASWLISRAHAVLGHGELALHHAEQCARWVGESGPEAADFDHGYVHEARARALACLGRLDEAGVEYTLAASTVVVDDDDRTIFEADLAAEPWYGLQLS
jgi:uncharacterized protein YndB with AHSA1/START domain